MRRLHAWLVRLGIVGRRDGCRDRFRSPAIGAASRDVRFGLRLLRRQPGFALIAITTLALGIGANTAVFAVVDAVLLRPLPYATPERIVEITGPGQGFVRMGPFDIQPPALRDSPAFVAMGVYLAGAVSLGGAPSVRVPAAAVSQGFFDVLGVPPAIGRTFTTADAKASGRIVVLGDRLWRERYRSDPSIVGQSIVIDGSPFVIFGVMPPGVSFPANASLWVPTSAPSGVKGYIPLAKVIARLADGVPDASVRGEVIRLAGNRVTDPTAVQVLPMREALVGGVRPMAVAIWIAAALVLLVACINATNLLLARVTRRRHEFAVRRALGASRAQVMRQVIVESLLLATFGAIAAIPATLWTIDTARLLLPAALHGVSDIDVGGRALWATAGFATLTTILFGLGPAMSIQAAAPIDLRRAGAATGGTRFWRYFRSTLVVAEIAIAIVLLAGATALVRTVRAVMTVDIGASGERALAIGLELPRATYRTVDDRRQFFSRLDSAVRAIPGVEEIGLSDQLPGRATAMMLGQEIAVEGRPATSGGRMAILMTASPGYFSAAGIDLIAGRPFTDRDGPGAPPVAIVSEGFARALDMAPVRLVGQRIPPAGKTDPAPSTIVGVVRDVRLQGPEAPFQAAVYQPSAVDDRLSGAVQMVLRASDDPMALVPAIRVAVARLDPNLPLDNIQTFDDIRAGLFSERRLAMLTMLVFAGLTFTLSAIGLYGVISYLVQVRTREIGIRLAIGASRATICGDVLRSGATHAAGGIGLGAAGALALSQVVASKVPAMEGVTPALVAGLALAVGAGAIAATLTPALRASRVDPALTLRAE